MSDVRIPWWVEPKRECGHERGVEIMILRWDWTADGQRYSYVRKASVQILKDSNVDWEKHMREVAPQDKEPASVFAKRDLTEAELLDPLLFTDPR